ncbi:MAG TPA: phosphoribosylanthranilate isomerase [Gemmatimonadaceae bacterium]|nr:phosphoribosylanthranilate isomerase [Gemmatimonadaceae bacterium]
MPDVKFCGLTRETDASFVAEAGGAYAGVIFAGGPRELAPERAARVLAAAGPAIRRVGVFGRDFRARLPRVLAATPLDVVQLHADPSVDDVREARALFGGVIWATVRVEGTAIPGVAASLIAEADALLLDARVDGALGGSGVALPWPALADQLTRIRCGGTVVLAGGLTAENVEDAAAALEPDVVDVSSGVEEAPGVKVHERMVAFAQAARRTLR